MARKSRSRSDTAVPPQPSLRLQILSDLHLDIAEADQLRLAPSADLVVVAGDTCAGALNALTRLRAAFPLPTPIVTVLGNHEFYGSRSHADELAIGRLAASRLGIVLLENDVAVVGDARFVGATLWTDYALYGPGARPDAMAVAARRLNDHRLISAAAASAWRPFLPIDAAALHAASVTALTAALAVPFDGPTVIVTHHGPHPACLDPRYRQDSLSAAFASDLSALIAAGGPDLWISGHSHYPLDLQLGRTRLVSNPHGYRNECSGTFDPQMTVSVPLAARRRDRP